MARMPPSRTSTAPARPSGMRLKPVLARSPFELPLPAWLLAPGDVIVIPKTTHPERLRENRAAAALTLSTAQRAELDRLFAPPTGASALEML